MKAIYSKWFLLALAGALAAGPIAHAQNNPSSANSAQSADAKSDQPGTDTWITTKVKSELATTKDVKSLDISVKTVNGVVTLTGTQPNSDAIKKAIACARGIKGVKDVDATNLTVKP